MVLVCTMLPCTDGLACEHSNTTNTTEINANSSLNNQEGEHCHCSPFCVCSCCGVSYFSSFELITFSYKLPAPQKVKSYYQSLYKFNFFHTIWHPPNFYYSNIL